MWRRTKDDENKLADFGIQMPHNSHIEVVAEPATQHSCFNQASMSLGCSDCPPRLPTPMNFRVSNSIVLLNSVFPFIMSLQVQNTIEVP
jgi:hypothetical protein